MINLHDSPEAVDDVESESDGDEGEGRDREEDAMQVVSVGEEAVDGVDEVASRDGVACESTAKPREESSVSDRDRVHSQKLSLAQSCPLVTGEGASQSTRSRRSSTIDTSFMESNRAVSASAWYALLRMALTFGRPLLLTP